MLIYTLRRLSLLFFTLLILSLLAYGIDRNINSVQSSGYFEYVHHFLTGQWGFSNVTGEPVLNSVLSYLPATLGLALAGIILATIVGVTLGAVSAIYRDRIPDILISNLSLLGFSIPIYWLATLLTMTLAMQLGWFPSSGQLSLLYQIKPITGFSLLDCWLSDNPDHMDAFFNALQHLILPASVLALATTTEVIRLVRKSLSEVIGQGYIKAALSRGHSTWSVILTHGLRNALPPILPMLSMQFGTIVTSAIITEQMFEWPGLGRWLISSILARDFAAVQACMLVIAITLIIINICSELLTVLFYPAKRKALYAQQG
ncbi:ABC transporter permease [Tolumonas lignilytica]|jgi:ABC-type antimicrobial peptide transport system, permease component|uniref:ABC transporter permease n=1 Tax=Tolumonas lignilytica TaxID=1283284 RepID=UPI000467687A|nr:ABC transporter permease subunit [Tolumonas lignilytica]